MKKEKKIISVPLDTGENRDPYGWDYEDRRVYGESYSSFCNFDVMPGVVAIGFNGPNPSLEESCYDPDILQFLNRIPGGNDVPPSNNLNINSDEILSVLSIDELEEVKRRINTKNQNKVLQKVK